MAWVQMQVATVNPTDTDRRFGFEYVKNIKSPGDSPWILIPETVSKIAVGLTFNDGARAKIQTTLSSVQAVKDGNAKPLDWPHGEIEEDCADYCVPVTAIRLVNTLGVGSVDLEVRAQ